MTRTPNTPNTPTTGGHPHPHPVAALRDHLTQTMTASARLRSILAVVDDPGRRLGEHR